MLDSGGVSECLTARRSAEWPRCLEPGPDSLLTAVVLQVLPARAWPLLTAQTDRLAGLAAAEWCRN